MKHTPYNRRPGEFSADFQSWILEQAEDNSDQMSRLLKNLRKARAQELTPRQAQLLTLYFDEGKNMTQISQELHINRSSISRTIARAKKRLYQRLQYTF